MRSAELILRGARITTLDRTLPPARDSMRELDLKTTRKTTGELSGQRRPLR